MQRGPAEDHSAGDLVLRRERRHAAGGLLLLPVQLPVRPGRGHVRRGLHRAAEAVGHRLRAPRGRGHRRPPLRRADHDVGSGAVRGGAVGVVPFRLRLRLPAQDTHLSGAAADGGGVLRAAAPLLPAALRRQAADDAGRRPPRRPAAHRRGPEDRPHRADAPGGLGFDADELHVLPHRRARLRVVRRLSRGGGEVPRRDLRPRRAHIQQTQGDR
mmetsp:Transcript_3330/g.10284  ORF Transcript_3330/g.10284 Transcript_3330/m.10284 type:complete len:214 (+) Transcript_3330:382-1023(+)